jgi:hypothetical protein
MPPDAADDAAVGQADRHGRSQQRHHHARIDESAVPTLSDLQRLFGAVELIDEVHSAHGELAAFRFRQVAQRCIETARPEKKRAMQEHAAGQLAPGT